MINFAFNFVFFITMITLTFVNTCILFFVTFPIYGKMLSKIRLYFLFVIIYIILFLMSIIYYRLFFR